MFGNRFPIGYEKLGILGQGGFAIVWEGKHVRSGIIHAVKQINTNNQH